MSEMNKEVNVTMTPEEDYKVNFVPQVHKVGRTTMSIAFCLAFLPVLYFVFVAGYAAPASSYLSVFVSVFAVGIGMWLTEPLAYWPVLGSAGTYMGYLAGNVGTMRFPVALSIQSTTESDINTPRGQILTIVGIGASVVVNLIILFVIVMCGSALLTVLPDAVVASFDYVMVAMLGCMLLLRFGGMFAGLSKEKPEKERSVAKLTLIRTLVYLLVAGAIKLLITYVAHSMATFGTAVAVGSTVLVAYGFYRHDKAKASQAE